MRHHPALLFTLFQLLALAQVPAWAQQGSIIGWGDQVLVDQADLEGLVHVSAGLGFSLALNTDSTIVAWGYNHEGQCWVPAPNRGFVAVAGGGFHSLGLKADGSVVAWGTNNGGQCNVPAPNNSFLSIAAGLEFSLGLKSDGSLVAWGYNYLD